MLDLGLGGLVDVLSRLETQAIKVYAQRCTRLRHRRSRCTHCADICPAGAIVWHESSLEVEPGKCTGCGLCGAVCPNGALEAQAPTNADLVTRVRALAQERGWAAFACPRDLKARGNEARAFVSVNCLGRLDESVLVAAVAGGCKSVALVDAACEGCPQSAGHAVMMRMVGRANALLAAYGQGERISLGPHLPAELAEAARSLAPTGALSRRGLFSTMARQTVRAGAVAADTMLGGHGLREEEVKKGSLPVALPARRKLLFAALKQLGAPSRAISTVDGLWARFGYRSACTGCRMCAFFCPTGALVKVEKDGVEGVVFRTSRCTNCGLCRDICYKDAVMLSSDADLNSFLEDAAEWLPMRAAGQGPSQSLSRFGL